MVFQDSLSALDPVYTLGSQAAEVGRHVLGLSRARAWARAVELLDLVGIRDPDRCAHAYPHELSGGMRQRAMLAVALATEPEVLLCDELTTALDVTVQAQALGLLADLRRRLGLSLVFVSHDLAVVQQLCDELVVMYTGRIVETGPTAQVLAEPLHPYTRSLLEATIDLDQPERPVRPIPVLPDVGSTIVPPGRSRPSRSAASINATAILSLIEPPGLNDSSFATSVGRKPNPMRDSRTNGVLPIVPRIESSITGAPAYVSIEHSLLMLLDMVN
jgi:ABC-type dipeptide/oligopeptide/nickel transport system ATPase component